MTAPLDDRIADMGRSRSRPVADGVLAWIQPAPDGGTEIMYVEAEREGTGAVGAWLDGFAPNRRVVVPNVTNPRLAGMLERRGYRPCKVLRPLVLLGLTWCDAWVRTPALESYWDDDGIIHRAAGPTSDFLCGLPNTGRGPIDGIVAAPGCGVCFERR